MPTRRAAILVGPEYGTVARADLTAAAREAVEAGFDLLIAASFNFDAHASEFDRMGALTVLQARINPDLLAPVDRPHPRAAAARALIRDDEPGSSRRQITGWYPAKLIGPDTSCGKHGACPRTSSR